MNILVLDCAFSPTVAIIKDDKLKCVNISENEKHSDNLMLLIDKSLNQANITINDIDVILANKGPGSFTGLRVAVSISKGLGFTGDIKFKTFTSFDYVIQGKNVLVPGFSNFVYLKNEKGVMSCEDINNLNKNVSYVTFDLSLYEKLKSLEYNVVIKDKISYDSIIKNLDVDYLKINELEPLYLRKSQAELERENKLK